MAAARLAVLAALMEPAAYAAFERRALDARLAEDREMTPRKTV